MTRPHVTAIVFVSLLSFAVMPGPLEAQGHGGGGGGGHAGGGGGHAVSRGHAGGSRVAPGGHPGGYAVPRTGGSHAVTRPGSRVGTLYGYGHPYGYGYRGLYGLGHLGYTSFWPGYWGLGFGYWGLGSGYWGPGYYGHGYGYGYGYPYYGLGYGGYGGYGLGYGGYGLGYGGYGDTGRVRIIGAPRNSEVYVDGYYVGIVDNYDGVFQRLDLDAGTHRLEIRAPGYPPSVVDILVQPGRTITYRANLRPSS